MGLGYTLLVPSAMAMIYHEWNPLADFLLSFLIFEIIGLLFVRLCGGAKGELSWTQGLVTAAFTWMVATFLFAIPYYLSGYYLSYLDAIFDVMSGLTTTGLTLIQSIDHLPISLNTWRHLLSYLGGQGIIVLALTFLKGQAGLFKVYVGEAKDERLLPNVMHTARAIWKISLGYLLIGVAALFIAGLRIGLTGERSLLHALWVYMAAWSTGGFAPQGQNILYYHSTLYEIIAIIFFVLGSFNFALHYAAWTGNRKELVKNLETVAFTITLIIFASVSLLALAQAGVYTSVALLFRKGFFHMISGHTTTGFMTLYARQLLHDWGGGAILPLIIVMLIGGSASSTAGGFKGIRMGFMFKGWVQDVKRLLVPETAVIKEKFHFVRDSVLEDRHVRTAGVIITGYLVLFAITSLAGVLYGFPLIEAVFEGASVAGNVGLSIGITSAGMPNGLKVIYVIVMWLARLEFFSVLVFIGFIGATLRRRTR